MNARWIANLSLSLLLLAGCLAGCASEQPKQIGTYPAQAETKPLAELPRTAPLPRVQIVYETWISLEVSRVASTAERAVDLASRHGGYLESSNSWLQDGRTHMTLVLAVPSAGFDGLREDLLTLGTLQNEQVSSAWTNPGVDYPYYSHITLTLKPRAAVEMDWPRLGWDPANTFRQALDVFVSIFGFLVDILIWVLVVVGPFVLIALGLRALCR